MTSNYDIAELDDGLEVRGVTRPELTDALELLKTLRAVHDQNEVSGSSGESSYLQQLRNAIVHGPANRAELTEFLELFTVIRTLQAEHVEASREDLMRALMGQGVNLTPTASLSQAQRLATHRNMLLATPFHSYASLGQQRGDSSDSNTRTWVARRREAHELFTVSHNGRALIPGFQFDEHGELRAELAPLLSALVNGGIHSWALWTWLTSPTSFLSGEIPERVASTDPARALRAAQRFAAPAVA
jgi:hypothetical protein